MLIPTKVGMTKEIFDAGNANGGSNSPSPMLCVHLSSLYLLCLTGDMWKLTHVVLAVILVEEQGYSLICVVLKYTKSFASEAEHQRSSPCF